MKKLTLLLGSALVLSACDGDMTKRVARAILEEEGGQTQQEVQPVAPTGQNQALHPVQPVQSPEMDQQVQMQPVQQPMQQPMQQQPVQQAVQQPMQPMSVNQQPQMAMPVEHAAPAKRVATPRPSYSEHAVYLPATVVTRHGSNVVVRRNPSKSARQVGYLYTTEQVWVIAETNKCETIQGLYNCWVKVKDSTGLVGYSFGGYLDY